MNEYERKVKEIHKIIDAIYEDGRRQVARIDVCNIAVKQILSLVEIKAANQDLTSCISFNLGILQGKIGGLFENYPDNFNLIMNKLGDKLKKAGFIRVIPKPKRK